MKYTADSWFFIQLTNESKKALEIWQDVRTGKSRLAIPTIVLVEITKRFLRKGKSKELSALVSALDRSDKIFVVELTSEISTLAGKFGHAYNIPTADSIILATAVTTGFTNLLSEDRHFIPAERESKIKRIIF